VTDFEMGERPSRWSAFSRSEACLAEKDGVILSSSGVIL